MKTYKDIKEVIMKIFNIFSTRDIRNGYVELNERQDRIIEENNLILKQYDILIEKAKLQSMEWDKILKSQDNMIKKIEGGKDEV